MIITEQFDGYALEPGDGFGRGSNDFVTDVTRGTEVNQDFVLLRTDVMKDTLDDFATFWVKILKFGPIVDRHDILDARKNLIVVIIHGIGEVFVGVAFDLGDGEGLFEPQCHCSFVGFYMFDGISKCFVYWEFSHFSPTL